MMPRATYSIMVGKFKQLFVRQHVIYERARFNQRQNEPCESVNTFTTALYTLTEHCVYGAMHDEMIRDLIVIGLSNLHLSEKIQLEANLTLGKTVTQTRPAESVKQQQFFVHATGEGPRPFE